MEQAAFGSLANASTGLKKSKRKGELDYVYIVVYHQFGNVRIPVVCTRQTGKVLIERKYEHRDFRSDTPDSPYGRTELSVGKIYCSGL